MSSNTTTIKNNSVYHNDDYYDYPYSEYDDLPLQAKRRNKSSQTGQPYSTKHIRQVTGKLGKKV